MNRFQSVVFNCNLRHYAKAKAQMSLNMNTAGRDFARGVEYVAKLCKDFKVEVPDGGVVTADNVFRVLDKLPEENQVREGAWRVLISKSLLEASGRLGGAG